ncbi:hypothetical protein FBU30_004571 [Linnemannia zychae]|nr:hypothetical protein FBU30_004571 [Linnemannia zychae]
MFGVQMRGGLDAIFSSDGTYPSSSDTPYAYNPSIGEVTQITTLPPSPPSSINDIGYMGAPISSPSSYGYGANADTREMDWLQTDIENHWVSSFLIIFGWVIFARALAEYAVAKKSESVLKAQSEREALEGVGIEHEEQDIDAASRSRVVAYLASEEDV